MVTAESPKNVGIVGRLHRGRVRASVDRTQALQFLGYAGQTIDTQLESRFEQMALRCEDRNPARYCWIADTLDDAPERSAGCGCRLAGCGLELPGRDVAEHLSGCEYVVLMAVTLGATCERELAQLRAVNALDHLLYDACASALVESAANEAHDQINDWAASIGLCTHARFSPGYGDLPLDVQPQFLQSLSAGRLLGLTVNAHNFLIPSKSITAVLGLFRDDADDSSPCAVCHAAEYCSFRERGVTCHGERV